MRRHYPLAFWMLLENYFRGTRPQKKRALTTLVQIMIRDPEAVSALMEPLRHCREEKASEILLKIAEGMDVENHTASLDKEDLLRVRLNTVRFYGFAGSLIRAFRRKRMPAATHSQGISDRSLAGGNGNPWSYEKVREELIHILRDNRCIRKAAAKTLFTTSANLRLRVFPRYRIDEKAVKREWVREAVLQHQGDIPGAAQCLGISPQTLRRRLRRYGMEQFCTRRRRSRQMKFVDRVPVAQCFREMYRGTVETAANNRRCKKSYLRFFRDVERWFYGRFRTDEERKNVFRLLRVSARRNRLRIQYLYQNLFGKSMPIDITEATRYKFCNGLLQEILGKTTFGTPGRQCPAHSDVPGIEDLVLALQVWALRHWIRSPLNWKEYRRSITVFGTTDEEEEPNSRPQRIRTGGPTPFSPR